MTHDRATRARNAASSARDVRGSIRPTDAPCQLVCSRLCHRNGEEQHVSLNQHFTKSLESHTRAAEDRQGLQEAQLSRFTAVGARDRWRGAATCSSSRRTTTSACATSRRSSRPASTDSRVRRGHRRASDSSAARSRSTASSRTRSPSSSAREASTRFVLGVERQRRASRRRSPRRATSSCPTR